MSDYRFFLDGEELKGFSGITSIDTPFVRLEVNGEVYYCKRTFDGMDVNFQSVSKEVFNLASEFTAIRIVEHDRIPE